MGAARAAQQTLVPEAAPAPTAASAPQAAPGPRTEADMTEPPATRRYVFEFECTDAQLHALMGFLCANGIHGTRRSA